MKIKATEKRIIDGVEVTINTLASLDYDGTEQPAGFDITVDHIILQNLIGWPTDDDIRKYLPKPFFANDDDREAYMRTDNTPK
jgi:hypothetical protein